MLNASDSNARRTGRPASPFVRPPHRGYTFSSSAQVSFYSRHLIFCRGGAACSGLDLSRLAPTDSGLLPLGAPVRLKWPLERID